MTPAEQLQEVKDTLLRPDVDAVFTDPRLYRYLTRAERKWKPLIALHAPEAMWSAPELMTTSDNKVFTLGGSVTDPIRLLVLESLTGEPLVQGAFWDPDADYVWEASNTIRITGGRERTFNDGPYARVIDAPGTIDASTASTILPVRLRQICCQQAAVYAAEASGGMMNPKPFQDALDEMAWGNNSGDVGLIGSLKKTDQRAGLAAREGGRPWEYWRPNG